jgi:hypothetical protein
MPLPWLEIYSLRPLRTVRPRSTMKWRAQKDNKNSRLVAGEWTALSIADRAVFFIVLAIASEQITSPA